MSKDFSKLMSGAPSHPDNQVTLANWRDPGFGRWSFSHIRQLLPTAPIAPSKTPVMLPRAGDHFDALQDLAFGDGETNKPGGLGAFLRASQTDGLLVMHKGKLIHEWYDGFGASDRQHIVFSVSKSITALLTGIVVERGMLDVDRQITDYLPEAVGSAYDGASVRNLLDMTVASAFVEDYLDTTGVFMAYRRASAWNPLETGETTEGLRAFLAQLPASDGNHGYQHHYCSTHTDMLGWVLEKASGMPINQLFSNMLFTPLGTESEAYVTLETYGAPRVAGGICVTPPDLMRLADMTRCGGAFGGKQIVPESWIADFTTYDNDAAWSRQEGGSRLFDKGTYRSKWYRTGFDDDEYCAIGIHGQWIWINPKREVSIVHLGSRDLPLETEVDLVLLEAFKAIARAVGEARE